MPNENRYLANAIPLLYRRQALDLLSFSYIIATRNAVPSITIPEAAASFMKVFKVDEDLMDLRTVVKNFHKTNNDLINAEKTEHKKQT